MAARFLRVVGMLVVLWAASVAVVILAAPPSLAVSYLPTFYSRHIAAQDLRLGIAMPLFEIEAGRILDYSWDAHTGWLAVVAVMGSGFESTYLTWIREPGGPSRQLYIGSNANMWRVSHTIWSVDGTEVVLFHKSGLTRLNPVTGETRLIDYQPNMLILEQSHIVPLAADEVQIVAHLDDGAFRMSATAYQNLNLQTGEIVPAPGSRCPDATASVMTAAPNGGRLYSCSDDRVIYLETDAERRPLLTLDVFGGRGTFSAPFMAFDGQHVLVNHTAPGERDARQYLYRLSDRRITPAPIQTPLVNTMNWIPPGAFRRGH